jgi:hypothetical protein
VLLLLLGIGVLLRRANKKERKYFSQVGDGKTLIFVKLFSNGKNAAMQYMKFLFIEIIGKVAV